MGLRVPVRLLLGVPVRLLVPVLLLLLLGVWSPTLTVVVPTTVLALRRRSVLVVALAFAVLALSFAVLAFAFSFSFSFSFSFVVPRLVPVSFRVHVVRIHGCGPIGIRTWVSRVVELQVSRQKAQQTMPQVVVALNVVTLEREKGFEKLGYRTLDDGDLDRVWHFVAAEYFVPFHRKLPV